MNIPSSDEALDSLLERSRNLLRHRDVIGALPLLLRAWHLTPTDQDIIDIRQDAREMLHGQFRLVEDLEQRAAVAPNVAALWVELGEALLQVDRDEDALAAFDQALELTPK